MNSEILKLYNFRLSIVLHRCHFCLRHESRESLTPMVSHSEIISSYAKEWIVVTFMKENIHRFHTTPQHVQTSPLTSNLQPILFTPLFLPIIFCNYSYSFRSDRSTVEFCYILVFTFLFVYLLIELHQAELSQLREVPFTQCYWVPSRARGWPRVLVLVLQLTSIERVSENE